MHSTTSSSSCVGCCLVWNSQRSCLNAIGRHSSTPNENKHILILPCCLWQTIIRFHFCKQASGRNSLWLWLKVHYRNKSVWRRWKQGSFPHLYNKWNNQLSEAAVTWMSGPNRFSPTLPSSPMSSLVCSRKLHHCYTTYLLFRIVFPCSVFFAYLFALHSPRHFTSQCSN